MIKKIAFLSVLSLVVVPLSTQAVVNISPKSGVTHVNVSSCEQLGQDIRISRNNGSKFILFSTTRNAGHGLRNYKLTCVTNTQYKVEWTDATQTGDVTLPTVSIISPQTAYSNGSVFNIAISASDNIGVARIELYRDGILIQVVSNQNILNYSQLANINVATSHSFYARVYDATGNIRQSNTTLINILSSSTPTTSVVSMLDNQYSPRTITIKTGTTVVWRNDGTTPHTVTSDSGAYTSGALTGGQTYSRTFNSVGTYPYYCIFYGAPGGVGMSGTVIVTN